MKGNGSIDIEIAKFSLESTACRRQWFRRNGVKLTIVDKFKGGPVGLTTIANSSSESVH
jgi:Holliday junction DNA helicase RuvB